MYTNIWSVIVQRVLNSELPRALYNFSTKNFNNILYILINNDDIVNFAIFGHM